MSISFCVKTAANPSINAANLKVGQSICIPSASAASYNLNGGGGGAAIIATTCASYYTIKSGDTFYSISNGNSALLSALVSGHLQPFYYLK